MKKTTKVKRPKVPKLEKPNMAAFNTLIIAAAAQAADNQFWADRGAGENTFSVNLVPKDGPASAAPPTNHIASGQFERYFPGSIFAFESQFPNAISLSFTGTAAANTAFVNNYLATHNLQRQVLSPI
jgi:hypothetical protein